MAEQESKKRISYVKPEALDLGSVAPIMGFPVAGSCVAGEVVSRSGCNPQGNAAGSYCDNGSGGQPPNHLL
jgi:hypothetical protein